MKTKIGPGRVDPGQTPLNPTDVRIIIKIITLSEATRDNGMIITNIDNPTTNQTTGMIWCCICLDLSLVE